MWHLMRRPLPAVFAVASLLVGCGGSDGHRRAVRNSPTAAPTTAFTDTQPSGCPHKLPADVLACVHVVGAPAGAAASRDAVWIASHHGQFLYRIDPRTLRVAASINLGQNSCGPLQVAFGKVWAHACDDVAVRRTVVVDATTNRIVGRVSNYALSVAIDDKGVWLADRPRGGRFTISRVDPYTLKPTRRLAVAHAPFELLYGAGSLWVSTSGGRAITRIDDGTGRTIAHIRVPEGGDGLHSTFIAGALWVTGVHVWRIAAATNRPRRAEIRKPDIAFDVSASAGRLWLRRTNGRAAAVDPKRIHDEATYPADRSTGGPLLAAFGSLWVLNFDADTVWQDRLN
jgi:hypothetical protein